MLEKFVSLQPSNRDCRHICFCLKNFLQNLGLSKILNISFYKNNNFTTRLLNNLFQFQQIFYG